MLSTVSMSYAVHRWIIGTTFSIGFIFNRAILSGQKCSESEWWILLGSKQFNKDFIYNPIIFSTIRTRINPWKSEKQLVSRLPTIDQIAGFGCDLWDQQHRD